MYNLLILGAKQPVAYSVLMAEPALFFSADAANAIGIFFFSTPDPTDLMAHKASTASPINAIAAPQAKTQTCILTLPLGARGNDRIHST